MRLVIFGVGYVGLVQGAVFAEGGHDVLCVDVDAQKIDRLRRGEVELYEPGLIRLLKRNVAQGRLGFSADIAAALQHGSVFFVAVGTPASTDGSADVSQVERVVAHIGELATCDCTIVIKSTVPVGTCERLAAHVNQILAQRGVAAVLRIASNPEFSREGSAVNDCMAPDRIVIGCSDDGTKQVLREIYASFTGSATPLIFMSPRSAELTKYAANCMLATKISFINEIAGIASTLGADIDSVRVGIGADPRIGGHFNRPGIGYGGSCFPKDVRALIHAAATHGFDPCVLRSVDLRNEKQKTLVVECLERIFGPDFHGRTFALWGLSFKPLTDDMREAPSRTILDGILSRGGIVRVHDPAALARCREIYGYRSDIKFIDLAEDALRNADALVVATEWPEYGAVGFRQIKRLLRNPIVIDGRNCLDQAAARENGIALVGIGRGIPVSDLKLGSVAGSGQRAWA